MQEGRGIGLSNKIKTYQLQSECGLDTLEANLALGFKDDERDFSIAGLILKDLEINSIRLITNNPRKIQDLQKYNVNITSRVKLKIFQNKYNKKYLETKFEKLGHIL
jgi:GTP cyclohydrolase II